MGKSNKFSLTTKSNSATRVNPYDKITSNALNVTCPDKQIVLPKLKSNGTQHVFIELYSFFIFIIALGTQYLNLYRSVWWLSKTRSNQAVNYHLIDLDVSQFSMIFIGQTSLITLLRALYSRAPVSSSTLKLASTHQTSSNISESQLINNNHKGSTGINNTATKQNLGQTHEDQHVLTATLMTATASWICMYYLCKCGYRVWQNFGFNGLSCISYPIAVSIVMNSNHIIQVVEECRKTGLNMSFLNLSITLLSSHIKFDDDKLYHNCSNQPDEIRDEVARLKGIFNERLKFVIFKSILLAYYSSFVPICFAQSFLYYDYSWAVQHVVITWFSSLIMLVSLSFMPYFYDILHRSAYHFGKWQRLEARNTLVPCINWSENVIYPQGKLNL